MSTRQAAMLPAHALPYGGFTPGPITASDTFLYQLAHPDQGMAGACNLWSGGLHTNNGFSSSYVKEAVALFVAAPNLLACLKDLMDPKVESDPQRWHQAKLNARAAIKEATATTN